jgi:hypothetical protein
MERGKQGFVSLLRRSPSRAKPGEMIPFVEYPTRYKRTHGECIERGERGRKKETERVVGG